MIRNFEAGGTQIWGAEFETDSDAEMSNLTPIQEDGGSSADTPANRSSYLDTTSFSESPGPMRRRQSEFRASLMKSKVLWQRAAKQVKLGGNVENRRRSILPIVDIDLETQSSNPSIDEDDDYDVATLPPMVSWKNDEKSNGKANGKPNVFESLSQQQLPHKHTKVLPISSLDIERDIKPQLKPARKLLGFIFPKIPTQFTKVNESLFQRSYSHKRKKTMATVNILYSFLLLALYILKLLPLNTANVDVPYIARETTITVLMIAFHIITCVLIKRANSNAGGVSKCAYITWMLLLLHTLITPITSLIDHKASGVNDNLAWDTFGTWQTALVVITTLGSLTVLPLRRVLMLAVCTIIVHILASGIMIGFYKVDCLPRVSGLMVIICIIRHKACYHLQKL